LYDRRRKTVERAIDLRESAEMHRELFRAIRSRNSEEARRLMEQHLLMAQAAQGMEDSMERKDGKGEVKVRGARVKKTLVVG
jgi:GntR family transcriptional repressor for pyruvate dehydrogenase complex